MLLCDCAGYERKQRAPCLPNTRYPANGPSQGEARNDARRLVHYEWEHGSKKHADDRDGDCVANERWDEPHDELEATK